jgi:hypothetical protein
MLMAMPNTPCERNSMTLVKDFFMRLKADPDGQASIARYQQESLASPLVGTLLNSIWGVVKLRLSADLSSDEIFHVTTSPPLNLER